LPPARSEPAAAGGAPSALTEEAAAQPAPAPPVRVLVGAYINDIQELDFKTNSYAIDLYVWFRWKGADLDPSKTMEFVNRYTSDAEKPKSMPDGSYQGPVLDQIPAREISLRHAIPVGGDGRHGRRGRRANLRARSRGQRHHQTRYHASGLQSGQAEMHVVDRPYPTNFGDLAEPEATAYSRLMLTIPVTRPIVAMSIKAFVPIGLIVACAALVFFVRPRYVEGPIGLGVTALLTLVALQLTSGASLPDVDYLMMIDKIYLLAYLFIILELARVVMTSWRGSDTEAEASISRHDRIWVGVLLAAYFAANLAVAWSALRVA